MIRLAATAVRWFLASPVFCIAGLPSWSTAAGFGRSPIVLSFSVTPVAQSFRSWGCGNASAVTHIVAMCCGNVPSAMPSPG